MARIKSYIRDKNINDKDLLLGSSYEGEGQQGPIYKTRSYNLTDLAKYMNLIFTVDDVNYNLHILTSNVSDNAFAIAEANQSLTVIANDVLAQATFQTNLAATFGTFNDQGVLISLAESFANQVLQTTSSEKYANAIFVTNLAASVGTFDDDGNLLTMAEGFADRVMTTTASDRFAESQFVDNLGASFGTVGPDGTITTFSAEYLNTVTAYADSTLAITSSITTLTADVGDNAAAIVNESVARVTATDALASEITTLTATVNTNTAAITTESTTRASETEALATSITTLTATVDNNTAAITTESTTRATETEALATQITTLSAEVDNNAAAITTESTARATEDEALATQITTLSATVDSNTAAITTESTTRATETEALATQITTLSATVDDNAAAITAEQTARATEDEALATSIETLTATVDSNTAAITTESTTRATQDTALATQITTLSATVDNNTAAITTESTTRATQDAALATSIETLSTAVDDNASAIETESTTRASQDTALAGQITTLTSNVGAIPRIYRQDDGPSITETPIGSLWFDTNDNNKSYVLVAGTPNVWTTVQDLEFTAFKSSATQSLNTLATNTSANATKITNLNATLDILNTDGTVKKNAADFYEDIRADVDANSATAASVTSLTATVGDANSGLVASVNTNSSAIATTDGKLSASYGMHVNAGGKIAGLKLLADSTTTSTFIAQADTFGVDMPNGSRVLTVNSSGLLLNGEGVFTGNISARAGEMGGWEIGDNIISGPISAGYNMSLNPRIGFSINSSDYSDSGRSLSIRKGSDGPVTGGSGNYTFSNMHTVNFNSWSDTVTASVSDSIVKPGYPIGIGSTFSGTESQGTFWEVVDWDAINGIATTSSNFSGSIEVGLYVQFANYYDFRTSAIIGIQKISSASTSAASTTLDIPAVANKVLNFVNTDGSTTYMRFVFERKVDIRRGSVTFSAKSSGAPDPTNFVFQQSSFQTDITPAGIYVGMGSNRKFRVDTNSYIGSFIYMSGGVTSNSGAITSENASSIALALNRTGTDGDIAHFRNDGVTVGRISVGASTTSYLTTSDYRLKENIVNISGALDRLELLKPCRFNFLSKPDKTVDGFIAHEVQDIVPEAIEGVKDEMEDYEITAPVYDKYGNILEEAVMGTRPKYQSIDQSKLVPLLVAAMQEMRAEYKAEIELLKSQINS